MNKSILNFLISLVIINVSFMTRANDCPSIRMSTDASPLYFEFEDLESTFNYAWIEDDEKHHILIPKEKGFISQHEKGKLILISSAQVIKALQKFQIEPPTWKGASFRHGPIPRKMDETSSIDYPGTKTCTLDL